MTTHVPLLPGHLAAPRATARRALPTRRRQGLAHAGAAVRFLVGTTAEAVLSCQAFLVVIGLIAAVVLRGPTVVVIGDSMQPNVAKGSVVVAITPEQGTVGEGAIVIFDGPNGTVTHRVVDVVDGQYVTRGDANAVDDSATQTIDSMRGQARLIVPWIGWPRVWLQQRDLPALGIWLVALVGLLGLTRLTGRTVRS